MRSTMQEDSPFYKGILAPYNVKHALLDPSHTFVHPPYHKTRAKMDFGIYDHKKTRDQSCEKLQHIRRETFDIHGNNILRLPEQRDMFIEDEVSPLKTYYDKKSDNEKFFKTESKNKINLNEFGKGNYLVAPKSSVGVPAFKNYFVDKNRNSAHQRHMSYDAGSYMGKRKALQTKRGSERRQISEEKFNIIRKMLLNEKKVSHPNCFTDS